MIEILGHITGYHDGEASKVKSIREVHMRFWEMRDEVDRLPNIERCGEN